MARRRSSRGHLQNPNRVDDFIRLRVVSPVVIPGDRRMWHPAPRMIRPIATFSRRDQSRIIVKKSSAVAPARNDTYSDFRVGFAVPRKVGVCVRRKQRKEVLHALKYIGKGSRARRHRWNDLSRIDCT